MYTDFIIIIVGFNEEKNLPKLFESLNREEIQNIATVHYIDQSSADDSVSIAKYNKCKTHIHPNKGYADPDKAWAVNNLCKKGDWVLILDADETLEIGSKSILENAIQQQKYSAFFIPICTDFLGIKNGTFLQPRLFQVGKSIKITDKIHQYFQINNKEDVGTLPSIILNHDLKIEGKAVLSVIEKQTRYAQNEVDLLDQSMSRFRIGLLLFWKPIQWFFGWGILHTLFFRGIEGWIYAYYMAFYQFTIYSLLYERSLYEQQNPCHLNPKLERL